MPDRLCCNGFTFQHGMGCKRTQPAIACFDNIKKKKKNKKFIPRGNKNNAMILHWDTLQKLPCMKELRFPRDDEDILSPGGNKIHHQKNIITQTKIHTRATLWKKRQIQTAELVLSLSLKLSGGWQAGTMQGWTLIFSKQFCYPLTLQCHHPHQLRQPLSTHWQMQNGFKHAFPENFSLFPITHFSTSKCRLWAGLKRVTFICK